MSHASTGPGPDYGPDDRSSDSTAHNQAAAAASEHAASLPLALVVLGVSAFLTHGILTMQVSASASPPGPKFFPIIVVVLGYIVGIGLLVQWLRARATGAHTGADLPTLDWSHIGMVAGSLVIFMLILVPVGWLISGALLFVGVAYGLGSRNHVANVLAGLALSSVIQLAFSGGLGLPLPSGILGGF